MGTIEEGQDVDQLVSLTDPQKNLIPQLGIRRDPYFEHPAHDYIGAIAVSIKSPPSGRPLCVANPARGQTDLRSNHLGIIANISEST